MAKTRERREGKRNGKFLTGLIAFLLGFIIALVVETGVIIGGGYYILNFVGIDTLFSFAGQSNRDENNNPIYIDTNAYATIMALINEITALSSNSWENMPLGTIIEMSPLLEDKLAELCDTVAQNYGVYIDIEDLKAQTGGTLQSYFVDDVLRAVRPYEVVTKIAEQNGSDIAENPYIITLLDGQEAATVTVGGDECVVYYDEYIQGADGDYYRIANNTTSTSKLPYTAEQAEEWLVATNSVWKTELNDAGIEIAEGSFVYRMYYAAAPSGYASYAVTRTVAEDEEGNEYYEYAPAQSGGTTVTYPAEYAANPQRYTGNYIIDEDGEREYLTYTSTDEEGNVTQGSLEITVGYMMDTGFDINTLYYVDLPDILSQVMGEDPILDMLFNGITLGEMYSRGIEFSEQVDQFALADIIKPTVEDDDIILYLCYQIRNVDTNNLTATYTYTNDDGSVEERTAKIILADDGTIESVVDAQTGEELEKTRVRDINDLVSGLDITVLTGPVEIGGESNIMAYIAYGITDIQPNGDGTYSAIYHEGDLTYECTVHTNADGTISSVVLDEGGRVISGATVDQISDRIDGAMEAIPLADLVPVTPSHIDADGNPVNNNIMLFTVYSATMQPAYAAAGTDGYGTYYEGTYYDENGYGYPARIYVKDGQIDISEQNISHVLYSLDNGTSYTAAGAKTSINEVEGQINRLTEVLTIGDIITINPDNRLMNALADCRINEISDAINEIVISDAVDIRPDEDIMLYVAFGVTDVTDNGDGTYSAIYHGLDGTTQNVTLLTQQLSDSDPAVIVVGIEGQNGAVMDGGEQFNGTIISQVGQRVGRLQEDLSITSVLSIDADSTIMMYVGYGVSGIATNDDGVLTGTYTDENGDTYPCVIEYEHDDVDGVNYVTRVYYVGMDGTEYEVPGTKIADIGAQVDELTSTLTIGEIIGTIDEGDILYHLKDYTVEELPDGINSLTIGQIVGEDSITEDDKILNLIKDSTVGNLRQTIDSLTVQDMYTSEIYGHYYRVVAENPSSGEVVYSPYYTYYTRGEDGTYIPVGNISRDDMDPDTTYYVHFDSEWLNAVESNDLINSASDIVFNPEYLYYIRVENPEDGTSEYQLVNGNGRLTAFDNQHEYFTRGRATGVWYLLLYDDVDGQRAEVSYTVNQLGTMMGEAANNLTNSTLWDFYEAGVIEEPSHNRVPILAANEGDPGAEVLRFETTVDGQTVTITFGYYIFKEVSECTIDEIMNAVTILTNLIN